MQQSGPQPVPQAARMRAPAQGTVSREWEKNLKRKSVNRLLPSSLFLIKQVPRSYFYQAASPGPILIKPLPPVLL